MFKSFKEAGEHNAPIVALEKSKPNKPTVEDLRARELELRDRYEGSHRDHMAKEFRDKNNELKLKHEKRKAGILKSFEASQDITNSEKTYLEKQSKSKIAYIQQYEIAPLVSEFEKIKQNQNQRGVLKKLLFRFKTDPLSLEQESLALQIQEKRKILEMLNVDLQDNLLKADKNYQKIEQQEKNFLEFIDKEKKDDRKFLFESAHEYNSTSRDRVRGTLESLESGESNVAKLARENNAIVVHSIPLDGWASNNTSMNNKEVKADTLSSQDKVAIIQEKQPDLSASLISLNGNKNHKTMYPFGFILDGNVMASYDGDAGTETKGEARIKHPEYRDNHTLNVDPVTAFKEVADNDAKVYGWNELIINKPKIKAIFIDEEKLDGRGDEVTEYFRPDQEEEVKSRYGESIRSSAKGTPTSGEYTGKEIFRIKRVRSGLVKALEYAQDNHPELPVYLRRQDGIYTKDGNKVTAEDIYSN